MIKPPGPLARGLRFYVASFRGLPRVVWLLCAVLFVNRAGTMVLPFMSLYLTERLGLSAAQVGWVLVSFGLGSLGGSYGMGRLCGRLGALPVMRWTLLGSGAGMMLLPLLGSFEAWMVGIFVVAFVADGFRPAVMAAMTDVTPPEMRTRSFTLLRLAANLGMTVGPATGGVLASFSYFYLFIADGMTCWAAAAVLLWSLPALPPRQSVPEETSRRALSASPLTDGPFMALIVVVFLFACVLFQIFGAFPLYLRDAIGLGERSIGLLLGLNAAIIVVLEMPLVKGLEKRNPFRLVGVGTLLLAAGFALMPLGSGLPFLAFTVAVWTLGEMIALPFSNTLVATLAGPKSGEYMGIYTATYSAAILVGPALGLWVVERFGAEALWFSVGLVGPLAFIVCSLLLRRSAATGSYEEKADGGNREGALNPKNR